MNRILLIIVAALAVAAVGVLVTDHLTHKVVVPALAPTASQEPVAKPEAKPDPNVPVIKAPDPFPKGDIYGSPLTEEEKAKEAERLQKK